MLFFPFENNIISKKIFWIKDNYIEQARLWYSLKYASLHLEPRYTLESLHFATHQRVNVVQISMRVFMQCIVMPQKFQNINNNESFLSHKQLKVLLQNLFTHEIAT